MSNERQPGPDADRIAELERLIEARATWAGPADVEHTEELRAELSRLRNEQPTMPAPKATEEQTEYVKNLPTYAAPSPLQDVREALLVAKRVLDAYQKQGAPHSFLGDIHLPKVYAIVDAALAQSSQPQDVREALDAYMKHNKAARDWGGQAKYDHEQGLKAVLALAQSDAQPGCSLIKGERGGISWGGSFYVEGDGKSIDEVREMMFAKTRCEALDRRISEKQLVRPDASGLIEAAEWHEGEAQMLRKGNLWSATETHERSARHFRARAADRSEK